MDRGGGECFGQEVRRCQPLTKLLNDELKPLTLRSPSHRIDFLVMPLLILGFFALQLDRGNMCVFPASCSLRLDYVSSESSIWINVRSLPVATP